MKQKCGAFQLQAGCTGFVYGLATAQAFISTGLHKNVLVIGTETISRNVDWKDRETCVLFGDGAGAVIVQACDEPTGVLSFVLGSDGSGAPYLRINMGAHEVITPETIQRGDHFLRMNGREVFKFAMSSLFTPVVKARARAQVSWRVAQTAAAMRVMTARQSLQKRTAQAVEAVKSRASAALLPLYARGDKRYTRDRHD